MERMFVIIAGAMGFLGVALGAFGAHGLRGRIDENLLRAYETGVLYHLIHAVALLGVAWASQRFVGASLAGWLMLAGISLFSGSLYAMALTGIRVLGAITPLGGLCFLGGWAVLAWMAFKAS